MKVKVAKWGSSLGVALPDDAVASFGIEEGNELNLTIERGQLRLHTSENTSAQRLTEMIAEMKRLGPEHEPETVDWGPDRGSEVIEDDYSRGLIVPAPDGTPVRTDDATKRAGRKE